MKKLLLLFILFSRVSLFGQDFTITDTAHGSKSELYIRANEWVAKTFNSAKDVIQMQDKEAGKIICKGTTSTLESIFGNLQCIVEYTITIDVKDGKYRLTLSDFIFDHTFNTYSKESKNVNHPLSNNKRPRTVVTEGGWEHIKNNALSTSDMIKNSFRLAMNSTKSDNW